MKGRRGWGSARRARRPPAQRAPAASPPQCPRELGVVPLAKQVSSGLRGCSEPAVLAAGLAALHALAACLAAGGAPADAG